jgi:hypothetical protein
MANFDTGQDILRNILRRGGDILPTETTETSADHLIDVKLYINSAYWEICALKPWRFNKKRKQFASIAEVTGSVSSIAGTSITLSATIATTMAGRKIFLDGDGIPHRISAHTAGTDVLTLEAGYTGSLTSGTFTIFQDEVETGQSDILAYPMIVELHTGDDLMVVPEGELLRQFPRNIQGTTRAQYAAFISQSAVRLAPWTESARLFEVVYNYRPPALTFDSVVNTDTPVIPQESRIVIAQRALAKMYADKRDARLEIVQKEMDETLARMSATETTFGKPRIRMAASMRI